MVGECFRRYLGLANGINVAGVSVGQMAFPTIITYLNREYGPRGAAVVISAMCLHLLVTAALMPRYVVDPDSPESVKAANARQKERKIRKKKSGCCAGGLCGRRRLTDKRQRGTNHVDPTDVNMEMIDADQDDEDDAMDTREVSLKQSLLDPNM